MMSEVTNGDRREIGKMLRFLRLVREGGMPQFQAYAEVYGEVVFEDRDSATELPSTDGEQVPK